jgi:hypothetical protein
MTVRKLEIEDYTDEQLEQLITPESLDEILTQLGFESEADVVSHVNNLLVVDAIKSGDAFIDNVEDNHQKYFSDSFPLIHHDYSRVVDPKILSHELRGAFFSSDIKLEYHDFVGENNGKAA